MRYNICAYKIECAGKEVKKMGFMAWLVKLFLHLAKIFYKLGLLNQDTVTKILGMIEGIGE